MAKMGRPITLPAPLGELALKLGGVSMLADEVGVSTRTIRRWAHGEPILPMPRKILTMLSHRHGVSLSGLFDLDAEVESKP